MTEAWSTSTDHSQSPFGLPPRDDHPSDAELCARIRDNRPDSTAGRAAFGELYARHRLPALHFALRLNRNRAQAEDAVAEAFAKIWRAWGQGSGPEESFKSYLMTAVRSESYRRTATTRATTVVEPDILSLLADSDPSDHADDLAERDQLARAFTTLPDAWQSAITLVDIDGMPTADAAVSMELSPGSFRSLLHRAREGLRSAYLQEHVEPGPSGCDEYSSELARYVRGQLSSKRARAVEAHLEDCAHCRRQTFRLRNLNVTFRAWITPAVLAGALIHIDHFPESALLVAGKGAMAGTSNFPPNGGGSSLTSSQSATAAGTAATGSSSGIGSLAAGVFTLKAAVSVAAAAAVVAAGAVVLVQVRNDQNSPSASSAPTSTTSTTTASTADETDADDEPDDEPAEAGQGRPTPFIELHDPAGLPTEAATEAPTEAATEPESASSEPPQTRSTANSDGTADEATGNGDLTEEEPHDLPPEKSFHPSDVGPKPSTPPSHHPRPTPDGHDDATSDDSAGGVPDAEVDEPPADGGDPSPDPSDTAEEPANDRGDTAGEVPNSDENPEDSETDTDGDGDGDDGVEVPAAGEDATDDAGASADPDDGDADDNPDDGDGGDDGGRYCHGYGWWHHCH